MFTFRAEKLKISVWTGIPIRKSCILIIIFHPFIDLLNTHVSQLFDYKMIDPFL